LKRSHGPGRAPGARPTPTNCATPTRCSWLRPHARP